jgi:hypothetical protein
MNQAEPGSDHVTKPKRTFTVLTGFLSKPERILFWFVFCYFVVELILAVRLQLENEFVAVAGWNPVNAVTRPSLLLIAAICLLLDRPPASVVAVLLAVSIIYPNLYLAFLGIGQGHGIQPFSVRALSIWFETIGKRQIVNTALALIIMTIGVAKVIAFLRWRSKVSASQIV